MKEVSSSNFGPLIAFLLPEFTALRLFGHRARRILQSGNPNAPLLPIGDPRVKFDSELVVPIKRVDDKQLKRIDLALDLAKPVGWTPLVYSLLKAKQDFSDAHTGPKTIVLVSDGVDTCNGKLEDVVKAFRGRDDFGMVIHTVGFDLEQNPKAQLQLRQIARIGRGRYFDARNGDALKAALMTAMTRQFEVLYPQTHVVVTRGTVNGVPIRLREGKYLVRIANGTGRLIPVTIDYDAPTELVADKLGSLLSGNAVAPSDRQTAQDYLRSVVESLCQPTGRNLENCDLALRLDPGLDQARLARSVIHYRTAFEHELTSRAERAILLSLALDDCNDYLKQHPGDFDVQLYNLRVRLEKNYVKTGSASDRRILQGVASLFQRDDLTTQEQLFEVHKIWFIARDWTTSRAQAEAYSMLTSFTKTRAPLRWSVSFARYVDRLKWDSRQKEAHAEVIRTTSSLNREIDWLWRFTTNDGWSMANKKFWTQKHRDRLISRYKTMKIKRWDMALTIAACCAHTDRFDEAVDWVNEALPLAPRSENLLLEEVLASYQDGKPYVERHEQGTRRVMYRLREAMRGNVTY